MVRFRDQGAGQLCFRYQGTAKEAEEAFSSAEFKSDFRDMVYGKEVVIPATFGEWGSFCKTQYAMKGGIANFLKAHLGVVALLDKLGELGFKVKVSDEGGFWEKRDISALVKEIGEWDAMIAAFGGALKDRLPEGTLEAEIFNRPDFEHLEMKGQGHIEAFEGTTGTQLSIWAVFLYMEP